MTRIISTGSPFLAPAHQGLLQGHGGNQTFRPCTDPRETVDQITYDN